MGGPQAIPAWGPHDSCALLQRAPADDGRFNLLLLQCGPDLCRGVQS